MTDKYAKELIETLQELTLEVREMKITISENGYATQAQLERIEDALTKVGNKTLLQKFI